MNMKPHLLLSSESPLILRCRLLSTNCPVHPQVFDECKGYNLSWILNPPNPSCTCLENPTPSCKNKRLPPSLPLSILPSYKTPRINNLPRRSWELVRLFASLTPSSVIGGALFTLRRGNGRMEEEDDEVWMDEGLTDPPRRRVNPRGQVCSSHQRLLNRSEGCAILRYKSGNF